VTSDGGMNATTCSYIDGTTFTCYYIDWRNAEGYTDSFDDSLNSGGDTSIGLSPLSNPMYAYVSSGYEYRHWLKEDSGFDIDIHAVRDIPNNARSGLNWYDSTTLQ
jgi:hypothetical protein